MLPKLAKKFQYARKSKALTRSMGSNERSLFSHALHKVQWEQLYRLNGTEEQLDFFQKTISELLDTHMPWRLATRNTNDKPWVTDHYRDLVRLRQAAHNAGDFPRRNMYKNKINRLSPLLQRNFFTERAANEPNTRKF